MSTLAPEILLMIAGYLDTMSRHSLIHALRPARDLLPLMRKELLEEAVRERHRSLMHWAAHIGCVECYLSFSYYKHTWLHSPRGTTPLLAAIQSGHEEIVRLHLAEWGYKPELDVHDKTRETALILACDGGYKAIVEMLLQWGVDPLEMDKRVLFWSSVAEFRGRFSLSVAASRGHTDIMSMLMKHEGMDINFNQNESWGCPLDAAVDSGQIAAIELLLAAGARISPGPPDMIFKSTIERALRYCGNKHRSFLAAKNNDCHNPRLLRQPPITAADAAATRLTMLSILCAHGLDLNTLYGDLNWTPLHFVAHHLAANAVRLIAGQNMSPLSPRNCRDGTPLHLAACRAMEVHELETFAVLLDAGADWAARDWEGYTPLDRAGSPWLRDVVGGVWLEAYELVAAQRRKDRRNSGWWLWWRWTWRDGEVWEGVAYYTWMRPWRWLGLTWGVPLLFAFETLWPETAVKVRAALERWKPRVQMMAGRVAALVKTWRESAPAVMAATLVKRLAAWVARMERCVVSVLNTFRGLRVHRFNTVRFNRRFWWTVIFGGLFLVQLLLVAVLNLVSGLNVGSVWVGANAVSPENKRHWLSPPSTHLQITGAHIVVGGCPSSCVPGGCEVCFLAHF